MTRNKPKSRTFENKPANEKYKAEWKKQLKVIIENEKLLNSWELDYMRTVTKMIVNDVNLTFGQSRKLREIFKRFDR